MKYLNYFSGKDIEAKNYEFKDFGVRCYFDNDSDELINHDSSINGLVNLDVYREMIRDLKAMGYNAIDIHDQLGRPEFYLWEGYKKNWDYVASIEHIEKIIDIIHEEGMMVQIPMYLGWGFHHLDDTHECYSKHKKEWLDTWKYYMKSALSKGDIFLLRPRSPIYDCEYRCECPECIERGVGSIMTEVFEEIEKIILNVKPTAKLVCDLYAEGHNLFEDKSFSVGEKWLLLYADSGFGKVEYDGFRLDSNHKKGIYLHAGFWLNHTLMDPHVEPLAESCRKAKSCGTNDYILVNGQSYKNFILNLELIMAACSKGEDFDIHEFLSDWCFRLFDIEDENIVKEVYNLVIDMQNFYLKTSFQKSYLTKEDEVDRGYQMMLMRVTYPLIEKINSDNGDVLNSYSKEALPFDKTKVDVEIEELGKWFRDSKKLLEMANNLLKSVPEVKQAFFYDQFVFPLQMLENTLDWSLGMYKYILGDMEWKLVAHKHFSLLELIEKGSSLDDFETWYHPKRSRQHHPIPDYTIFKR